MKNFLKIDDDDLLIDVPKKYYFNEQKNKFIYSSLKNEEVIGLSNNLNGKIIEVKKQRLFNKKSMSYINTENQEIGWVNLVDSIRIYRLPNLQGKYSDCNKIKSNDLSEEWKDRMIKASYIYFENNNPFLLISKVGSEDHQSIPLKDFHKANTPTEVLEIELETGMPLYKDSRFSRIERCLEEETKCKVIIYFEELNELRVQLNGKNFWVKKVHNFNRVSSNHENVNYELIDMIVYIKKLNKVNKAIIQNQNNRLKNIESNITISSDLGELYLNKYLGDTDGS